MNARRLKVCLAAMLLVALTLGIAGDASAQCNTCPAPTVAYQPVVGQPVVAQPTVAYRPYTGWYPGKWLDQWRLRRAGVSTTAPAYTAAYAPTYTAAYAPAYTASYAPTYTAAYTPASYTAAYRPYVTSYAPLSVPVAASCNTCTQTVARQVLMRPVVAAPACNTCSFTPSCGCDACSTGCDACASGVSQATYNQSYTATPACPSCAGGSSNVLPPSNSVAPGVGPATTQPSLSPVPAPNDSRYQSQRPIEGSGSREADAPADNDPVPVTDPDSSTWYNAPRLLDANDRTATRTYKSRKPTVDIWTAVYRDKATNKNVSQTNSRRTRTQAEIDADGWSSVAR